jgi:NTE family protein
MTETSGCSAAGLPDVKPIAGPRGEWAGPRSGTGLALSGGGFRAALFGLGSLWRLNELGWLRSLRRITSVSGGSLTAGVLASRWNKLAFDETGCATNFEELVALRLRQFCSRTLDWKAIVSGLIPLVSAAAVTRRAYDRDLVRLADGQIARLSDLPVPGTGPDFVFFATCVQTGSSFRFTRDGLYDWKLGRCANVQSTLGTALAASAAFPPFLSPLLLKTDPTQWLDRPPVKGLANADRICERLHLGDGGIYDNMGTEALWKTMDRVLVSDAGAPFAFVSRPWFHWGSQLGRVRDILIEQTRALRKRMLIRDLQAKRYSGAYWGIQTRIGDYTAKPALCADSATTQGLAQITTRLKALDACTQERLINWGYALADAAIRTHVDTSIPVGRFPYPENGF